MDDIETAHWSEPGESYGVNDIVFIIIIFIFTFNTPLELDDSPSLSGGEDPCEDSSK